MLTKYYEGAETLCDRSDAEVGSNRSQHRRTKRQLNVLGSFTTASECEFYLDLDFTRCHPDDSRHHHHHLADKEGL